MLGILCQFPMTWCLTVQLLIVIQLHKYQYKNFMLSSLPNCLTLDHPLRYG